jgi:hypothetical protein
VCSTHSEKSRFTPAWRVTPGPCLRFFELGATIETISRLVVLFPLGGILADGLLERDVLARLAQLFCKARPLADQCLVADFDGRGSGDLVGCQQAGRNVSIGDILQ